MKMVHSQLSVWLTYLWQNWSHGLASSLDTYRRSQILR